MSVRNQVEDLVKLVQSGHLLEAFDKYYAEDVVMQENSYPATAGKAVNREREIQFLSSVKEVHEATAKFTLVDGEQAVIGWVLDFTNTEGKRLRMDQVAHQTWADGQIIRERFYYDTGSLVVEPVTA